MTLQYAICFWSSLAKENCSWMRFIFSFIYKTTISSNESGIKIEKASMGVEMLFDVLVGPGMVVQI